MQVPKRVSLDVVHKVVHSGTAAEKRRTGRPRRAPSYLFIGFPRISSRSDHPASLHLATAHALLFGSGSACCPRGRLNAAPPGLARWRKPGSVKGGGTWKVTHTAVFRTVMSAFRRATAIAARALTTKQIAFGCFILDDVGAEIAQDHRTEWTGRYMRQVDDDGTFERQARRGTHQASFGELGAGSRLDVSPSCRPGSNERQDLGPPSRNVKSQFGTGVLSEKI
jgi:hypothetical protein